MNNIFLHLLQTNVEISALFFLKIILYPLILFIVYSVEMRVKNIHSKKRMRLPNKPGKIIWYTLFCLKRWFVEVASFPPRNCSKINVMRWWFSQFSERTTTKNCRVKVIRNFLRNSNIDWRFVDDSLLIPKNVIT